MGDIVLSPPLNITISVIKVTAYSVCIRPNNIQVNLQYYDQDNSLVKSEIFSITGADYNQLVNNLITQQMVGQKFIDVIERGIRNKVKQLKNWSGTVTISV